MSTEKIESFRVSTYMSLDCLGVRLELYLSGVCVHSDVSVLGPYGIANNYQKENRIR